MRTVPACTISRHSRCAVLPLSSWATRRWRSATNWQRLSMVDYIVMTPVASASVDTAIRTRSTPPLCITVDFQTNISDSDKVEADDGCVTIRDPRHDGAGSRNAYLQAARLRSESGILI